MPLTPAEVHNVAFKKPPIGKRGYDEEEVDAFLDIVEVELSRLIEENNDLRSRLASGGAGAPVVEAAAPAVDDKTLAELAAVKEENARLQGLKDENANLQSVREENSRLQNQIGELEKALNGSKSSAQQQVVQLQQQLAQTEAQLAENKRNLELAQQAAAEARAAAESARVSVTKGGEAPAAPAADHHQQAVQMLALAQQTADQHLAQSKAEAERLLDEARSSAESQLADAEQRSSSQLADAEARSRQLTEESSAKAAQTVSDAEQRAATITAQFEQRKAALERRIEELRTFEREYRSRLKSYLESQLRDLDASGKAEPANAGELAEAQQG